MRRGLCAPPLDSRRTVDAVWVTLHPSQYVLLVDHAGWDRQDYQRWMQETVYALLTA